MKDLLIPFIESPNMTRLVYGVRAAKMQIVDIRRVLSGREKHQICIDLFYEQRVIKRVAKIFHEMDQLGCAPRAYLERRGEIVYLVFVFLVRPVPLEFLKGFVASPYLAALANDIMGQGIELLMTAEANFKINEFNAPMFFSGLKKKGFFLLRLVQFTAETRQVLWETRITRFEKG